MTTNARIPAVLAAALLTASCAYFPREAIKPEVARLPQKPLVPAVDVAGDTDPPVRDLALRRDDFVARAIDAGDPLPSFAVRGFNASDAPLLDAMQALLDGTGVAVTVDEGIEQLRVSAINLSGTLPDVVEHLSAGIGVFYTFRNNMLRISGERAFVVEVPPALGETAIEDVGQTISSLGALQVQQDRPSRLVAFRAGRRSFESIADYLAKTRRNRVLVVFQAYIFEVQLADQNQLGLQWNNLVFAPGAAKFSLSGGAAIAEGLGFGAVYNSRTFSIDALLSLLATQGTVSTVSKPSLTMVSGSRARFAVGSVLRYVSRVSSTATATGVVQATAEKDELPTGLELAVAADWTEDTVHTSLNLKVTDVVRFEVFQTLGTTLRLPQTTQRAVDAAVRARPGDTILLAGINSSRDFRQREGIPLPGLTIPKSSDDEVARTELVIVLQPKIVRFVEEGRAAVAPGQAPSWMQAIEQRLAAGEDRASVLFEAAYAAAAPAAILPGRGRATKQAEPGALPAVPESTP